MKKLTIAMIVILIVIVLILGLLAINNEKMEIIEISSKEELEEIYYGDTDDEIITPFKLVTLPFSILYENTKISSIINMITNHSDSSIPSKVGPIHYEGYGASIDSITSTESTKEYSTTNIQVENVDEADITKTDGDYIYSLSEDKVVITDVKDETQIKIASEIEPEDSNMIPSDLILYNDKLVVISGKRKSKLPYYETSIETTSDSTTVTIYDISDREQPKKLKNYQLKQPYYTSRCIDGRLYVISSGYLKKESDKIVTYYYEDGKQIDPGYKNIKKIKNIDTDTQTILSMLDLNNINETVKVNSYLMDIEKAYVSENNIYLLDTKSESSYGISEISSIFGLKGILGAFEDDDEEYDYKRCTYIYKFNLLDDGSIEYDKKAKEKGEIINQFSIDEYEGNLRVALDNSEGSRIVIFNDQMKKIGETEKLVEGEIMYSSRFLGDRAYLVPYKTIDSLFVIDLSNTENPQLLGELKISGYSTYLHPYDENHLIGIGMQTEEKVSKDSSGRVISTRVNITGMKMALFDVRNVNHPIQISDTIIGDSKTTSAILTNHKALLFSKEKELLAIPVNNYTEDFEIENSSDDYESIVNSYTNYNKEYVSEGYFVYNINLTDGFTLKGTITHDKTKSKYTYNNTSRLLRGLYIDDNLYTVSEDYIKVNSLDDLQEISQVKIKED